MSSDTLAIGAFGVTTATLLHQISDGKLMAGVLVPAVGVGLIKVGQYCKSNTINTIGSSIIFASVVFVPGSTIGYAIYAFGGKTLAAKTIACIVGSGITYKVFSMALDFIAKGAARGVASVR